MSLKKNRLPARLTRPWLVGTLLGTRPLPAQLQTARKAKIDVLEIRLDTFSFAAANPDSSVPLFKKEIKKIRQKFKGPLLLTFRAPAESGKKKGKKFSDQLRQDVVCSLIKDGDWFDVEIRRRIFRDAVIRAAKKNHKLLVISQHHFKGLGSFARLKKDAKWAQKIPNSLFKVAVAPRNEKELARFLFFCKDLAPFRAAFIPMGEKAKAFRILGFSFGSLLTYASLGQSAAPGQMPAPVARQWIRSVYGP